MRWIYNTLLIGLLFCVSSVFAQVTPFDIQKYSFISYNSDSIIINDNQNLESFFYKLDTLILQGRGKMNIVHIGDSHIQADYVSGQLRKRFQEMAWGLNGGRGFIFPVQMAKTNNPWNYRVKYSGTWASCKNVQNQRNYPLGLAGFMVFTQDKLSSLHISFTDSDYPEYYFNSLRVYHNMDTAKWDICPMDTSLKYTIRHCMDSSYSVLKFENDQTFLDLEFHKKGETGEFHLYGLCFENDDPGIVYHSVGVNGAEVESWLKCSRLKTELASLSPDLIIISLGTNDSYTSKFDSVAFEKNMRLFLDLMNEAAPQAAVLWVTPGDNYRYRKYLNYSTQKASEVIIKLGKEYHVMVWDFYNIMGRLNAIMNWYYAGLTAKDRLHYTKQGYVLQGDLLHNAFLRAYNQHIDKMAE